MLFATCFICRMYPILLLKLKFYIYNIFIKGKWPVFDGHKRNHQIQPLQVRQRMKSLLLIIAQYLIVLI
jgi:hypothetical protein